MAWYVVSYDLRREITSADWHRLYDVLRTAVDFCWPLQSMWIIETPRKPSEVIQILINQAVIDDDDGVIVLEITGNGDFRRVRDAQTAEWLLSHINRQ